MKLDKETLLFRCRCKSFEFVVIGRYDDETYITISSYPKSFKDKLKVIWWTLIGKETPYMSDEILLDKEDIKELREWL